MNKDYNDYMIGSSRLVSEANSRGCEGLKGSRVGQVSCLRRGGHTGANTRSLVEAAYSSVISPARLNLILGKDKP